VYLKKELLQTKTAVVQACRIRLHRACSLFIGIKNKKILKMLFKGVLRWLDIKCK
jgi:hypothetical protein